MKKVWAILSSILVILSMAACQGGRAQHPTVTYDKETGFTIITDTITIDTREISSRHQRTFLTDVLRYRDRYILLYEYHPYTNLVEMDFGDGLAILSISKDGQNVIQIPAPSGCERLREYEYDLKVIGDSLYFHRRGKEWSDIWDEDRQEWYRSDSIPESSATEGDFAITELYHGEWGEYVQFHEKNTGKNYIFSLFYGKIRSIVPFDGAYYIIESFHIRKVTDPRKGWEKNGSIHFVNWEKLPIPQAGVVVNTKYKAYWEYDVDIYHHRHGEPIDNDITDTIFHAGFLHKDELYILAGDGVKETYLAKYTKAKKSTIRKVLSWEGINLHTITKTPLLCIFGNDKQAEGLFDISGDTIRITYLKEVCDTMQYQSRQIGVQIIDFIQNSLESATIEQVQDFERSIEGCYEGFVVRTDCRGNTMVCDTIPDYERVQYLHVLDNRITMDVGYCYHRETRILTSAVVYFESARSFSGGGDYQNPKFETVDSIITQGLSVKEDSIGLWHKNNHVFYLSNFNMSLFAH